MLVVQQLSIFEYPRNLPQALPGEEFHKEGTLLKMIMDANGRHFVLAPIHELARMTFRNWAQEVNLNVSCFIFGTLGLAAVAVCLKARESRRSRKLTHSCNLELQNVAIQGNTLLPNVDPCCQAVYFVREGPSYSVESQESQSQLVLQKEKRKQMQADLLAASYSNFSLVELTFGTDSIFESLHNKTPSPSKMPTNGRTIEEKKKVVGHASASESRLDILAPIFTPSSTEDHSSATRNLGHNLSSSDTGSVLTNNDSLHTLSWTPPPQNPIVVTKATYSLHGKTHQSQQINNTGCKAIAMNNSNISDVSNNSSIHTGCTQQSLLRDLSRHLVQLKISPTLTESKPIASRIWATRMLIPGMMSIFQGLPDHQTKERNAEV
jgi:hypothetical protein